MFIRLLKVIIGFAFATWIFLNPSTAIFWGLIIWGLIFALWGIAELTSYVVVGPRTSEQVAKDDIGVNNIKNLLKNNG
jgi:hypothetical protein